MLFTNFNFFLFLPIVLLIFWGLNNQSKNYRNLFLLLASYFFYACWNWKFLILIILSSFADYLIGNLIETRPNFKKLWLGISLSLNLGFLLLFKYMNFFIEEFVNLSNILGFEANISTLNLILPVGISFYTFQTLSYSIDVYRGKIEPCKDVIAFFTYVAFFPQLVAGPIEKAGNLLPQFYTKKSINDSDVVSGLRQMLWGFFLKIALADTTAPMVDQIFNNHEYFSGPSLILGAILFSFQIYGDFAGYTHIAIGTARLFGFDLMQNFNYPYFSRDISEFWRRWHISLSAWFKEYLYIPLGGSRGGKLKSIRNIFAIFLVSGFWHGANLTFIAWGLLHSLFYLPMFLRKTNRSNVSDIGKSNIQTFLSIIWTFLIVTFAWIFFRADTLSEAFQFIINIFLNNNLIYPVAYFKSLDLAYFDIVILLSVILIVFITEWRNKRFDFPLREMSKSSMMRFAFYLLIIFFIVLEYGEQKAFIYFQF